MGSAVITRGHRTLDDEQAVLSRRQLRQEARAEAAGAAASTRDLFLDVVVLLSVLMFLALAVGIGMLALQAPVGG